MKIEHEQQVVAFTAGLPGLTISDLMEKYRTIEAKKKEVKEQLEFAEALLDAIENQNSPCYIMPTYTAMLDLRDRITKRYGLKEYWEK